MKREFWSYEPDSLPEYMTRLRSRMPGGKIVFTNGCFDLLHVGHIRMLQYAADLGDFLLVGINTDDSVRRIKGTPRPIQTFEDRMEIITSLHMVTAAIPIHENTALKVIQAVRPDIYVKGSEYGGFNIPEAQWILENGGEVHMDAWSPDHSTTAIINTILSYDWPDAR